MPLLQGSTVEWSPSIRRVACGLRPERLDLDVAADSESVEARDAHDAAALEHDRVVELGLSTISQSAAIELYGPDVAVRRAGCRRR